MLEFNDILKKYKLPIENATNLSNNNENEFIKLRKQFIEKFYIYNKESINILEQKKHTEEILLNELINDLDKDFVNKIYINDKDKVEKELDYLINNKFYVLESEKKIMKTKDKINYFKNERLKYEIDIVNKLEKKLNHYKIPKEEIKVICYKIKNISRKLKIK